MDLNTRSITETRSQGVVDGLNVTLSVLFALEEEEEEEEDMATLIAFIMICDVESTCIICI